MQEIPMDTWLKKDILAEVAELEEMAQSDPETFGPLLEDALVKYRAELV